MEEKLLSTGECAERKGVTRQAIHAAIRRGKLPARKIGPNYAVLESDCEVYQPAIQFAERSQRRWANHEKSESKPNRGRGRPRKKIIDNEFNLENVG